MRIAILGAGAMGSLFGGLLAIAENDVSLITRSRDHVSAVNDRGLLVEWMDGTEQLIEVSATTNPADLDDPDLLVVFVKSYDTDGALESAKPLLDGNPTVLTLQNGLGNPETITDYVPEESVVAGTTSMGAVFEEPGRVRHAGAGQTVVGRYFGVNDDEVDRIATALTRAGAETTVAGDIQEAIWEKALVNVGINAASALARVRNGAFAETEPGKALLERAIAEGATVARAEGLTVADDIVDRATDVATVTSTNHSSMRQDVESKRRTEIESINGEIVRRAQAHDVAVPVNRTLTQLIRLAEEGYDDD